MNKINTFTDRAARDVVSVVRRVKRTIPPMFGQRRKVLDGGGGKSNSYVYEITGSFVAGSPATAKATIFARDEVTVVATNVEWIGNLHMFDDHAVGSKGICKRVGNVYVAENSPCSTAGNAASATPLSTVVVSSTPPADTSVVWIDTSGLP